MTTEFQSAFAVAQGRRNALRRTADLIRISALRALKVRYRGSALGVLWSFFNPLLMTAVYTAIFGTAFSKYYDDSIARYVLSAFVGLVVVSFFMAATTEALTSVVNSGPLLNKIAIPPVVFPLSAVAANVFQQAITTFPIILVVSLLVTHDPLRVLLVPVVFLSLVALAVGFSLALATLYVFFRDLPNLWSITGFMLWITSPLFYPIELTSDRVRPFLSVNPIGIEISALREVALHTGPLHGGVVLAALASSALSVVVGAVLFRSMRHEFMDLL